MRISDWSSDVCSSDLDGDWARTLGRRYGDHTAFSIAGNLGKRSLCVDLKTDGGRTLVQRLAAQADVFIEGFRPGVAQRMRSDERRVGKELGSTCSSRWTQYH